MIYDLVIRNGTGIFFTPDREETGITIGLLGKKIKKITTTEALHGKREIDATGKIISPGFIDFHSHVDGKIFSATSVLRQGATTTLGGGRNFDGKTNRKIFETGFLINHGFYISHSFTLRRAIGIKEPYRAATVVEIGEMSMLAEKFLQSGSFGIHFGLEFVPGTSTEEIIAMARLAKKYNRVAIIHLRNDGYEALEGINEIIYVAEQTGASIHILHLMYMVGFPGVMEKALTMIDEARLRGLDITADTGLYSAFPSCIGSSILDGNWEAHYGHQISENCLMISSGIYAGTFCNKEMFSFLREEFPNTLVTVFVCDEKEAKLALKKPYVFVSTNAADGPHYEKMGHPETSGTFPKLFHDYVKQDILPLTEAIKKITYYPAQRFGITNKGNLVEGYDGDIVIFDLETVKDCSNYVGYGDPNMPPEGIDWVIVNGHIVLDHGILTEYQSAGEVLVRV